MVQPSSAQSTTPSDKKSAPTATTETLVVLGTAQPIPLAESSATVIVVPITPLKAVATSAQDLLREDSAVYLEQRGAGGGQADISLRGGGSEQTLVLVNGFRVNDAQTGHHNLDLPLPLDGMSSVELLHGAGSTLHGADALSGVVDFLTTAPSRDSIKLRAGGGSFGETEQALAAALMRRNWSGRLTADRDFSTGFMADRDYRNEESALENWLGSRLGTSDLILAGSDRSFGANKFYGNYNSWERTKSWFAGLRQELGSHTVAAFGYRVHTDDFVLLRTSPSVYENNHRDTSWQASLRRTEASPARGISALFGLEADGDAIHSINFYKGTVSNALGTHARNRGAGYLNFDLRPAKSRWNLSAGAREEIFSGGRTVFSPHLAGSLRLADTFKLRAAGGYGFRLPTYTDLFYKSPATLGNAQLKPESAWSGEGGLDWTPAQRLSLSATGFYRRQHDTIDYVRATTSDPWVAENINGLSFAGFEGNLRYQPIRNQSISVSWTALNGAQKALHGLLSEYVFNYPVQNLHANWTAQLPQGFAISNSVRLVTRYQATPYPVWDTTVACERGRVEPYLRLSNLANTGYQEISGVQMPGRSIVGGFTFFLSK